MKAIALILLILGATVCYGDNSADYEYWNVCTEDQKIETCFFLSEGLLATITLIDVLADSYEGADYIDSLEKKMYCSWVVAYLWDMIPPDITKREYAREIMYRIELQYLQEEYRKLSLSTVFTCAVVEAWEKTLEEWR